MSMFSIRAEIAVGTLTRVITVMASCIPRAMVISHFYVFTWAHRAAIISTAAGNNVPASHSVASSEGFLLRRLHSKPQ